MARPIIQEKKENPLSQSLQISFKIRYELLSMYMYICVSHVGGLLLMNAASALLHVSCTLFWSPVVFGRMRTNWLLHCWPTEMASHGYRWATAYTLSYTSELRLVWNAMFGRMGAAEVSESAGWAIDPRVVRNGSTITRELYAVWKNRKRLLTSPSLERFPRLKFTRTST